MLSLSDNLRLTNLTNFLFFRILAAACSKSTNRQALHIVVLMEALLGCAMGFMINGRGPQKQRIFFSSRPCCLPDLFRDKRLPHVQYCNCDSVHVSRGSTGVYAWLQQCTVNRYSILAFVLVSISRTACININYRSPISSVYLLYRGYRTIGGRVNSRRFSHDIWLKIGNWSL